jgi:KipI family sensor histidine kinase inhibitor
MSDARIEPLGDSALLILLGERIDVELNARALAIAQAIGAAALPGVRDVAPAYASVCVQYDPCAWTHGTQSPFAAIAAQLQELVRRVASVTADPSAAIEIPVCYGGDCGADLADVSRHTGLTPQTVIERHCASIYRVAMLGFAPGFPYLLGLDASLHMPRRATPRTRVPAGSVAIGGAQTGIYPRDLPGGWHLIGRTPLALFDAARSPPALLAAGQTVRFRAIDAAQFAALAR